MHSTSLKDRLNHCISVYACLAQAAKHEDVKGLPALLFIMVVVVTTLILHLRVDPNENTEQVQENICMPKSKELAIDIPNLVPLPAPPLMKTPHPSHNLQDAISPNPTNEAEQTSHGIPTQSTVGAPPTAPNLKMELKVATWVTIIAAGAIVSVVSGVIGNEKALLPRKLLFKGFISLNYVALVCGIGLFSLIKINPDIPGFVRIVKFIMWMAIGSLVYSLGMATCIMFPAKVEVVLVLVVPLVILGLFVVLSFARRE